MDETNIEQFKAMETQETPTVFSGPITVPDQSTLIGFIKKAFPTIGTTGQTVTIIIAKLTTTGSNGSLTFTNGILTSHVNPT